MSSKYYLNNVDAFNDASEKVGIITEPANVKVVHNGIILPPRYIENSDIVWGNGLLEGGVCDENGVFVAGQRRSYIKEESNRSCIKSYAIKDGAVVRRKEKVIFGGILTEEFGHLLMDSTSRLWYLKQMETRDVKWVFVRFPGCKESIKMY